MHAFLSRKAKGIIGSMEQTAVGFINGVPERRETHFRLNEPQPEQYTMNAIFQQMLHTWTTGGWVMAALALVALITVWHAPRIC